MSSEPPDPIESFAKGLAKGALEWTSERLDKFVRKFIDKDLAFIEDQDTINIAKELRNTGEWAFFKKYVDDSDLRILFQMGLTLRRLDNEKKELLPLKNKIKRKYDSKGLHIAFFVQNGLFSKYVALMLERVSSLDRLKLEIRGIFEDIDNKVAFITREPYETSHNQGHEIISKIMVHSPKVFIISGSNSAMRDCEEVKNIVMNEVTNYTVERYEAPANRKNVYFLIRDDKL